MKDHVLTNSYLGVYRRLSRLGKLIWVGRFDSLDMFIHLLTPSFKSRNCSVSPYLLLFSGLSHVIFVNIGIFVNNETFFRLQKPWT